MEIIMLLLIEFMVDLKIKGEVKVERFNVNFTTNLAMFLHDVMY